MLNHVIRTTIIGTMCVYLLGCASSGKIANVQTGMTKAEVVAAMGPPDTVSAQGNKEFLSYFLCYSNCAALIVENRGRDWYFVKLIDGRVDSFGRKGDFDSTKTPITRIERTDTVKQDVQIKKETDRYAEIGKLKKLLDSGAITHDEYEQQKRTLLAK